MNTEELKIELSKLEKFVNDNPELQKLLFDNPFLMTEEFEENNKQKIEKFLESKKRIREIKFELLSPKGKVEYLEEQKKLKEKFSED